ncbi:Avenacosidase 1 [Bienertia sinuspersici]
MKDNDTHGRKKIEKHYTRERLDRFLLSPLWLSLYPNHYVEHMVLYRSDHSAILMRQDMKWKQNKGREIFEETTKELENELDNLHSKHEAYGFLHSGVAEVREGN